MWGDPERAHTLDENDELAAYLLQISGPSHVPMKDARWQEILLHFGVWMHVEVDHHSPSWLGSNCIDNMSKHAAQSSNLAALALHASRMLRELTQSLAEQDMTQKIALVGKARATCGTLNLLRIFLGGVVVTVGVDGAANGDIGNGRRQSTTTALKEALTYTSRDGSHRQRPQDTSRELVSSILGFISEVDLSHGHGAVPELYDTVIVALETLLVLCSTQLYQPMQSSYQQRTRGQLPPNYFLHIMMEDARERRKQTALTDWTPRSVLQSLLHWQISRQVAPERSVSRHTCQLAQSLANAKAADWKVGLDGMYETHLIVMAEQPQPTTHDTSDNADGSRALAKPAPVRRSSSRVLLDATRGALVLSSSILFLPFRLMRLALVLLGGAGRNKNKGEPTSALLLHQSRPRRTNDVLWLTDSPVADLATSLLLLLLHNCRSSKVKNESYNPFRTELAKLHDKRWEDDGDIGLPPLGSAATTLDEAGGDGLQTVPLLEEEEASKLGSAANGSKPKSDMLMINFEKLFESFGLTVHNEVGALWLYTMLQASPMFATSIAVRSDLDTLVVPLLRTLYFSSTLKYHGADVGRKATDGTISIKSCPFRSASQLYLILILLLLLSQDPSFGPDAFRRSNIGPIKWYKERHLREISLGSLLILVLLRSLTLNLNRLHDAFLLSNCCAVLMNLSPHVVLLHDYAAMRLVSVTISSVKKYMALVEKEERDGIGSSSNQNGGARDHQVGEEEDLNTLVGMYGEVSRTLLNVLRHCVSAKNLEKNLHVVYALVYHQVDFFRIVSSTKKASKKTRRRFGFGKLTRLEQVIRGADKLIQENGDARTAPKAMKVLQEGMDVLQSETANTDTSSSRQPPQHQESDADFTFSYEEEADPEIFFIPYIWEVIVCCVTSSLMDWDVNRIQVFDLLEEEEDHAVADSAVGSAKSPGEFSSNVDEVV